jgi:subtilisin family serine protease
MQQRRWGTPITLVVGLLCAGGALELMGQANGRSVFGRAAGTQGQGCQAPNVAEVIELPPGTVVDHNDIPEELERSDGPSEGAAFVIPGKFVVKFASDPSEGVDQFDDDLADIQAMIRGVNARGLSVRASNSQKKGQNALGVDRTFIIDSDLPFAEIQELLEGLHRIDYVEPVMEARTHAQPTDEYWSYQWNMTTIGARAAWKINDGTGVVVAVVDTGVALGEDAPMNLVAGYDFIDDDDDPTDEQGHGTHVAGTIAQATDNGVGVVGLAHGVSIMPVRVLDENGSGSWDGVAEGVIWAVDNGAHIINMSLGGPADPVAQVLTDALDYAYNNDVTVVVSSGNDGFNNSVSFPGNHSTTIAVGAVDMQGDRTYYSNSGAALTITAPGGDTTADLDDDGYNDGILQETFDNNGWQYLFFQGTSMSSPHVAAAAALVYSQGITDPDHVLAALTETAEDLGKPGWDKHYGHGLVNPKGAMEWTPPSPEQGPLKMRRLQTITGSERRGAIRWTTKPGTTVVTGSDGFVYEDDELLKQHRVIVKAAKGASVTYTVTTETADGQIGVAEVQWPFTE